VAEKLGLGNAPCSDVPLIITTDRQGVATFLLQPLMGPTPDEVLVVYHHEPPALQ
jgi:hypothetical protein